MKRRTDVVTNSQLQPLAPGRHRNTQTNINLCGKHTNNSHNVTSWMLRRRFNLEPRWRRLAVWCQNRCWCWGITRGCRVPVAEDTNTTWCLLFLFPVRFSVCYCQNNLMGILMWQEEKQHMTTPAVCRDRPPHCWGGGGAGGILPTASRRPQDADHTTDHKLGGKQQQQKTRTVSSSETCDIRSERMITANSNSTTSCGMCCLLSHLLLAPLSG